MNLNDGVYRLEGTKQFQRFLDFFLEGYPIYENGGIAWGNKPVKMELFM
jgi:hypothetical protein